MWLTSVHLCISPEYFELCSSSLKPCKNYYFPCEETILFNTVLKTGNIYTHALIDMFAATT